MTSMESSAAAAGSAPTAQAHRRIEYSYQGATRVADRFALSRPVDARDFPDRGNINQHTFLVHAGSRYTRREYLLQRINHDVFTEPRHVMAAMKACIRAQREYLKRNPLHDDREWQTITLIPTRGGEDYLELLDEHGITIWRMMVKIPEARTYKSLGEIAHPQARICVAEEAGRGLAMYGDFTSGMDAALLARPLPGYRDTQVYFNQLLSVLDGCRSPEEAERYLPEDPVVREATLQHFLVHIPEDEFRRRMADPDVRRVVALARDQQAFGMVLLDAMKSGTIRTVAIHGDTKLDNFLFSTRTGRVKALVDLDTIMPHTWLVDWGDMVRSLVNVAGEKEPDLSQVQVHMGIFAAIARGFLTTAREVTPAEVALMVDAIRIIALELGIRFLADYLRGDSYFKLGSGDPADLNKTRALVQLTLFERLRERDGEMRRCIADLAGK